MVSGMRLAHRREIVSHPPENICSMATAEPVVHSEGVKNELKKLISHDKHTRNRENVAHKVIEVRKL